MDDLLTSIRRIMAEDEGMPMPARSSPRASAPGAHARRNEEVPMDLSPSEADRLPELVERSIMNAFAGLGEDEDEAPAPRAGQRRTRGEDPDHSAAMASIADALAREFSAPERRPREERPAARGGGWPHVLSEPGLDEETIDDFDEDVRDGVRGEPEGEWDHDEAPIAAAPAREPERHSRSAPERVASLRGRLEPRFTEHRDDASDHGGRPGPDSTSAAAPVRTAAQSAEAPRVAADPPREGRAAPAANAREPARERPAEHPAHGAHPAAGQPAQRTPATVLAHPAAAGPDDTARSEGNVFRRPAEKRAERAEDVPKRADDAPKRPERPAPSAQPAEATHQRTEHPEDGLTSAATRESIELALDQLSRTVISPSARTLEDLVRDMMRPLLREWLDANLAAIVERTVRQEIERVASRRY